MMCDFENHDCIGCNEHHILAKKYCKQDNLPVENGVCHVPCDDRGCAE